MATASLHLMIMHSCAAKANYRLEIRPGKEKEPVFHGIPPKEISFIFSPSVPPPHTATWSLFPSYLHPAFSPSMSLKYAP